MNWPPKALSDHFTSILANDTNQLSLEEKAALERFLSANDKNLSCSYDSLCKNHPNVKPEQYLIEICNIFLDVGMYSPAKKVDVNKWYKTILADSHKLSSTLGDPPSGDIQHHDGLNDLNNLLLATLEAYGDDKAPEELLAVSAHLRRILQNIPVTFLIDQIARLAEEAAAEPYKHYWENDHRIDAPKKIGNDGKLGREQILARAIKRKTLDLFQKPANEFVTSAVNALLGEDAFTVEAISKIPV